MDESLTNHTIIAGFGVPGRAAAEWLAERDQPYCVVELNPNTVTRCGKTVPIIAGDVCSEQVLRSAGIERAAMLILAVPNDKAVLETISIARRLNPSVAIIARCAFISVGLEATRRGAKDVVIAEQVVADEFLRVLDRQAEPSSD